jgi:hypothetical protein
MWHHVRDKKLLQAETSLHLHHRHVEYEVKAPPISGPITRPSWLTTVGGAEIVSIGDFRNYCRQFKEDEEDGSDLPTHSP